MSAFSFQASVTVLLILNTIMRTHRSKCEAKHFIFIIQRHDEYQQKIWRAKESQENLTSTWLSCKAKYHTCPMHAMRLSTITTTGIAITNSTAILYLLNKSDLRNIRWILISHQCWHLSIYPNDIVVIISNNYIILHWWYQLGIQYSYAREISAQRCVPVTLLQLPRLRVLTRLSFSCTYTFPATNTTSSEDSPSPKSSFWYENRCRKFHLLSKEHAPVHNHAKLKEVS